MTEIDDRISIGTLFGGAAIQLVDDALQRVWDNTQDPNTASKKSRKVVLTIEVKPDEKRDLAEILLSVESKLAAPRGICGRALLGVEGGRATAVEHRSRQTDLEYYIDGKVTDLDERRNK